MNPSKQNRSTINSNHPAKSPRTILSGTVLLTSLMTFAVAFGVLPPGVPNPALRAAQAQNFGQRTIQGKVLDDREAEVGGATVFLKNLKSRSVKSFTSTPDGSFRFAQVGMVDDYEVWAEQGKRKSPVKTVSSFDSRKTVDYELKLK